MKEINENVGTKGSPLMADRSAENGDDNITLSEEDCLQTYPFETLYVMLGLVQEMFKESKIVQGSQKGLQRLS